MSLAGETRARYSYVSASASVGFIDWSHSPQSILYMNMLAQSQVLLLVQQTLILTALLGLVMPQSSSWCGFGFVLS